MYYREVKQIKSNEKMSFDGTVEGTQYFSETSDSQ